MEIYQVQHTPYYNKQICWRLIFFFTTFSTSCALWNPHISEPHNKILFTNVSKIEQSVCILKQWFFLLILSTVLLIFVFLMLNTNKLGLLLFRIFILIYEWRHALGCWALSLKVYSLKEISTSSKPLTLPLGFIYHTVQVN